MLCSVCEGLGTNFVRDAGGTSSCEHDELERLPVAVRRANASIQTPVHAMGRLSKTYQNRQFMMREK